MVEGNGPADSGHGRMVEGFLLGGADDAREDGELAVFQEAQLKHDRALFAFGDGLGQSLHGLRFDGLVKALEKGAKVGAACICEDFKGQGEGRCKLRLLR